MIAQNLVVRPYIRQRLRLLTLEFTFEYFTHVQWGSTIPKRLYSPDYAAKFFNAE